MIRTYLIPVSLCLFWMLSPDVLVRLGQGAGAHPILFLPALALAAVLAGRSAALQDHPQLQRQQGHDPADRILVGVGPVVGTTLLVASRLSLALLIPTGVLVTSGYAFNEIFVYWFPNFGFAYLLLVLITGLHLFSEQIARLAQVAFALLVVASLLLLCLIGLGGAEGAPVTEVNPTDFSPSLLIGGLLLFLGMDLSHLSQVTTTNRPSTIAVIAGLLLFVLWVLVSLHLVPATRLTATSIPHLITARAIWGDPGRMLMGIAIIAGSCGVVNGLFHLAIGAFKTLARQGHLPGHPQGPLMRRRYVALMGLIIAVLMGRGLAGYEILDIYIQSALLLWLAVSGVQSYAAAKQLKRLGVKQSWQGYVIMMVYLLSAIYLLASDPEVNHMVRFLALTLLMTGIVVKLGSVYRSKAQSVNPPPDQGGR